MSDADRRNKKKENIVISSKIIILASLVIVLLLAAIHDIRFRRIPNGLTYPVMCLATAYHTVMNGLAGFLFSTEGIFVGIAVLIVPYFLGGMGAGDAKLMGAVGGLLGPKGAFVAFLFTALIGGVYAIIIVMLYGFIKETVQRYGIMLKIFFLNRKLLYIPPPETEKTPKLRYGVAIAVGTLLSVFMNDRVDEIIKFI